MSIFVRSLMALASLGLMLAAEPVRATGTFAWDARKDQVSADLKSEDLLNVLGKVSAATGWHIYVEPDVLHPVSAKFKDLSPGDAMHLLFGGASFALIPSTNAAPQLYVFRTSRQNATRLVRAVSPDGKAKVIANELIVRLKPGAKIDDLARLLGAKVIGRIGSFNAYRLQFDGADAADGARAQLASNSDVLSVDSNYSIDRPPDASQVLPMAAPQPQVQLDPPPDGCQSIVGIVDTGAPNLGPLAQFVTKQVSVVGDAPTDPSAPPHGYSMVTTLANSSAAAGKGHTSVRAVLADVYGPNPTTSTFDVAQGIAAVINDGAKIVNLSLGSDADSSFLHTVIQDGASKDIVFIGAAGNTPVTTPFYPAAYPEVDAVTAMDQGQLAAYANRGSFVTLGAPGNSVVNYDGQSWSVTGTSASAAFTSGIAAAYLAANPCAAPSSIQSFLKSNLGVNISSAAAAAAQ
jgi:hypothetical protein